MSLAPLLVLLVLLQQVCEIKLTLKFWLVTLAIAGCWRLAAAARRMCSRNVKAIKKATDNFFERIVAGCCGCWGRVWQLNNDAGKTSLVFLSLLVAVAFGAGGAEVLQVVGMQVSPAFSVTVEGGSRVTCSTRHLCRDIGRAMAEWKTRRTNATHTNEGSDADVDTDTQPQTEETDAAASARYGWFSWNFSNDKGAREPLQGAAGNGSKTPQLVPQEVVNQTRQILNRTKEALSSAANATLTWVKRVGWADVALGGVRLLLVLLLVQPLVLLRSPQGKPVDAPNEVSEDDYLADCVAFLQRISDSDNSLKARIVTKQARADELKAEIKETKNVLADFEAAKASGKRGEEFAKRLEALKKRLQCGEREYTQLQKELRDGRAQFKSSDTAAQATPSPSPSSASTASAAAAASSSGASPPSSSSAAGVSSAAAGSASSSAAAGSASSADDSKHRATNVSKPSTSNKQQLAKLIAKHASVDLLMSLIPPDVTKGETAEELRSALRARQDVGYHKRLLKFETRVLGKVVDRLVNETSC